MSVVPVDWHVPPPDSSAVAHTAVLPCATAITFELYGLVVSMEEAFATLGLYEPNLIRRILAPAGKEVTVAEMFPWVGPAVRLRFKTDGEVVTRQGKTGVGVNPIGIIPKLTVLKRGGSVMDLDKGDVLVYPTGKTRDTVYVPG